MKKPDSTARFVWAILASMQGVGSANPAPVADAPAGLAAPGADRRPVAVCAG